MNHNQPCDRLMAFSAGARIGARPLIAHAVHLICVLGMCHCSVSLAKAGPVEVFTDRSLFVDCLTWKVDFETRGDGSPISIAEDYSVYAPGAEWRNQGLSIRHSSFLGPAPGSGSIVNWSDPQLEEAISRGGSGPNLLWIASHFVRFELTNALPTFGFATFHRSDRPFDTAFVFDRTGALLETVVLDENFLTGRVEGESFGRDYDILHGFVGFHSPIDRIGAVRVLAHATNFDDFHIGIIPEPMTVALLLSGVLVVVGARRGRSRIVGS